QNCFTVKGVVIGHTASIDNYELEVHGQSTGAVVKQTRWGNDNVSAKHIIDKSRGATVGSHVVVQSNDAIGDIFFEGSDGAVFREAAKIRAIVNGTPSSGI